MWAFKKLFKGKGVRRYDTWKYIAVNCKIMAHSYLLLFYPKDIILRKFSLNVKSASDSHICIWFAFNLCLVKSRFKQKKKSCINGERQSVGVNSTYSTRCTARLNLFGKVVIFLGFPEWNGGPKPRKISGWLCMKIFHVPVELSTKCTGPLEGWDVLLDFSTSPNQFTG